MTNIEIAREAKKPIFEKRDAAFGSGVCQARHGDFAPIYPNNMPLAEKVPTICARICRTNNGLMGQRIAISRICGNFWGYGDQPACMAKTGYSFSNHPTKMGGMRA
ncbi:MAG: formate--tetrahydrofolate ligase [Rhodobacteraceae bacterium]|nr:formate--tetrahydrofolate ligase [Paracoccaceae bacterium]